MPSNKPTITLVSHSPDHGDGSIHQGDTVVFATSPADFDQNPISCYGERDGTLLVAYANVSSDRDMVLSPSVAWQVSPGPLTMTAHLYGTRGGKSVSIADTTFEVVG